MTINHGLGMESMKIVDILKEWNAGVTGASMQVNEHQTYTNEYYN